MTGSSIAGIITACATLLTAFGGILVALKVIIPNHQETKSIHKIVNQQRTDSLRYQHALVKALERAGIEVPEDQSVEDPI